MSITKILKQTLAALLASVFLQLVFLQLDLVAQYDEEGNFNPDSLTQLSISGTAIVDSSIIHPIYYLDENSDGVADYHLNFGPYWYAPGEGNGKRPIDGEVVTVTGGSYNMFDSLSVLYVYEINGEFWRDPNEPVWNNMGRHSHDGSHHQDGCGDYAFGFDHDTLVTATISGIAVLDTTFIIASYYLDQNGDTLPEYFLNFGPPWYNPNNGMQRPGNGDQITIVGGIINNDSIPMIVVYSINGNEWRDSMAIGNHLGGDWANKNMTDSIYIHSTFDDDDWMHVQPGWYNGGGMHGGGMMTDSLFFQMLEVLPQNIPYIENENAFAGYEMGIFLPDGSNGMWSGGECGGMMNFNSNIDFNLHFNHMQSMDSNITNDNIKVKYWDTQAGNWREVLNVTVSSINGTAKFSLSTVSNYLILTSSSISALEDESSRTSVNNYELKQNYPNPFNPSTIINYQLPNSGSVSLKVYDLLGRQVAVLVDQQQSAGSYDVTLNASNLASGIYFYELKSGSFIQIRKMMFLK